jgi:small-conductance mechanosensitive channel
MHWSLTWRKRRKRQEQEEQLILLTDRISEVVLELMDYRHEVQTKRHDELMQRLGQQEHRHEALVTQQAEAKDLLVEVLKTLQPSAETQLLRSLELTRPSSYRRSAS